MLQTEIIASFSMAQQANHPLPAGLQLEEYTITRQLSLGGFSIVYLATDGDGNRVAIKEYLPNSLALRGEGEIKPLITSDLSSGRRELRQSTLYNVGNFGSLMTPTSP